MERIHRDSARGQRGNRRGAKDHHSSMLHVRVDDDYPQAQEGAVQDRLLIPPMRPLRQRRHLIEPTSEQGENSL